MEAIVKPKLSPIVMRRFSAVQAEVLLSPKYSLREIVKRHNLSWSGFQRIVAEVGDRICKKGGWVQLEVRSVHPEDFYEHIRKFLKPSDIRSINVGYWGNPDGDDYYDGEECDEEDDEEDDDYWGCDDWVEAEIERLNDKDD
ncbi:MAG: hypothetical protein MN733_17270 [Nitrososphaera sp.]|nr:hypothetical protein [Nitrososphaera sp.]